MLNKYLLVCRLAALDLMSYRLNFFLHIIKYVFFISLSALIWIAVNQYAPSPLTTTHQITQYFLLAAIVYGFSNFHTEFVEKDIREGTLSLYLLKPISSFLYYFFFQATIVIIETSVKILILATVLSLFAVHGLMLSPSHILFFISLCVMTYIYSFSIYFLISGFAFWFQEVYSLRLSILFIHRIFSGIQVPLLFFPVTVQSFLFFTPFPHLASTPISVLQNTITLTNAAHGLLILTGWAIIIGVAQQVIWKKGLESFEGQGI